MLIAFLLAALNLAVRLPRFRRPLAVSMLIGILYTLMLLTKTTAVFLLPALGWAIVWPLHKQWRKALGCAIAAGAGAALTFGGWMAFIAHKGLLADYKYLFFINTYTKPTEWYWPVLSLWWSVKGGLWIGHALIPLAGLVVLLVAIGWRRPWAHELWCNPVFGSSVLALAGYILFMTYQNHPQPRYYVVVALFSFFVLAMGTETLLAGVSSGWPASNAARARALAGFAVLVVTASVAVFNAVVTLGYVAHAEYTWVNAARNLTRYIDEHPNGNRMLVSISGDEITMITHLPSLCDDFGTEELPKKLAHYQPGWWATWNDIDPGTLEDLHIHYSLQQVATFHAFDHPDRDALVLFKLHPLPNGKARDWTPELTEPLPDDKIDIPVQ
jgi:hypothetical protein